MFARRLILIVAGIAVGAVALAPLRFDRFQIATGSMAPVLLGTHRRCVCPRCGYRFAVGAESADVFKAHCPNCGKSEVACDNEETPGDVVAIDRWAYALKPPGRWDVVLFRRGEKILVKRVVGLRHEGIEIREGDVWINGSRHRKSFAEAMAMRQEIFDDASVPSAGWGPRWERSPNGPFENGRPIFDGNAGAQTWTFASYLLDERQYRPLFDEYAYEGAWRADAEPVHDFIAEVDLTLLETGAELRLALTDGADIVEATVPVDGRPMAMVTRTGTFEAPGKSTGARTTVRAIAWLPGETRRLTLAFVDRRGHLAIDGKSVGDPIDLPDPASRQPVTRPFRLTVLGGRVRVDRFRLARDVHYRPQGMAGQAVRLGSGEYFVLGDHSSVADDSRSWPQPGVRRQDLLGRLRLPTR